MPIDLMYGDPPNDDDDDEWIPVYAQKLKIRLRDAYNRVCVQMGHKLDRQK